VLEGLQRIAVKRLVAVEVEPERSHQHELNAGRIRSQLGFPEGRTEGSLTVILYERPDAPPEVSEGRFTLYDAREAIPGRQEYRLYYEKALMRGAQVGDLLVLYRKPHSHTLRAIVAPSGTDIESELLRLLNLGSEADLSGFLFVEPRAANESDAVEAYEVLVAAPGAGAAPYMATDHPLYRSAIAEGQMPYTLGMAAAGQELAAQVVTEDDPDAFLSAGLAAETELFYAIRERLLAPQLKALASRGLFVTDVLEWSQRQHQSAKSRRGDSLQHHFAHLLQAHQIPHSPQCRTEGKRKPDFVVPGCDQYHDVAFPPNRLRMVACKSTIRERWPQILLEADRIPDKFLLTLDRRLTDQAIRDMAAKRLHPFLPESVRLDAYPRSGEVWRLRNVAALMAELEAAL
jgi:hypothetical protein